MTKPLHLHRMTVDNAVLRLTEGRDLGDVEMRVTSLATGKVVDVHLGGSDVDRLIGTLRYLSLVNPSWRSTTRQSSRPSAPPA